MDAQLAESAHRALASLFVDGELTTAGSGTRGVMTEADASTAVAGIAVWGVEPKALEVKRERWTEHIAREDLGTWSEDRLLRRRGDTAKTVLSSDSGSGSVLEVELYWGQGRLTHRILAFGRPESAGQREPLSTYTDLRTSPSAAIFMEGALIPPLRRSMLWLERLSLPTDGGWVERGEDFATLELEAQSPVVEELFRSEALHGVGPKPFWGRHALKLLRFTVRRESDGALVGREEQVSVGGDTLASLEWRIAGANGSRPAVSVIEELRLPSGQVFRSSTGTVSWAPLAADEDLSWVERSGEVLEAVDF